MKRLGRKICVLSFSILVACLLTFPLHANASTLTLLDQGNSAVINLGDGGVYAGLYHMSLDGNSISAMCDDYLTHIYFGDTWGVDVWTYNDVTNGKFYDLGNAAENYSMAGWLFSQTFGVTDANTLASINAAIWSIFDPALVPQLTEQAKIYYANAQSWGSFNWSNVMYVLTPAEDFTSQEFLTRAPVPEPATMLLLGVGLVALAGFGRKKLRTA
jgi:hypothetical protein